MNDFTISWALSVIGPALSTQRWAWLGMRRSNTEPIVRLVVASADAQWVFHVVNTLQKFDAVHP